MKMPFALQKSQKPVDAVDTSSEESVDPESAVTGQQTHFAEELPLFALPVIEQTKSLEPKKPSKIIFLIPVLFLFVILGVMMMFVRGRQTAVVVTPSPTPLLTEEMKGELDRRLDAVAQDIEKADPLQPELAFPPISFELNLEDATLRLKRTQIRR